MQTIEEARSLAEHRAAEFDRLIEAQERQAAQFNRAIAENGRQAAQFNRAIAENGRQAAQFNRAMEATAGSLQAMKEAERRAEGFNRAMESATGGIMRTLELVMGQAEKRDLFLERIKLPDYSAIRNGLVVMDQAFEQFKRNREARHRRILEPLLRHFPAMVRRVALKLLDSLPWDPRDLRHRLHDLARELHAAQERLAGSRRVEAFQRILGLPKWLDSREYAPSAVLFSHDHPRRGPPSPFAIDGHVHAVVCEGIPT